MQNANNRAITKTNKPLVPLVERNDYVMASDSILGRPNSKTIQTASRLQPSNDSNLEFSRYLTNSIVHGRIDEARPRPMQSFGFQGSKQPQQTQAANTSSSRQVDIDTYVREQRKLIHQVSHRKDSGDWEQDDSGSNRHVEIREFRREQREPRERRRDLDGSSLEFKDILKLQSMQKSKRHLQALLSGLDRSGVAYRTADVQNGTVSQFDVAPGRSPHTSPREFRTLDSNTERYSRPLESLANRSILASRRMHPPAEFLTDKKPKETGYVFEENSVHSRQGPHVPKGIVDRRVDRFARKSHNKSMDAMKLLGSEGHSSPTAHKELIFVGDDKASASSLAQLFKKKMKAKDKAPDRRINIRDDQTSFRHDMMTPEASATITEPKEYCRNKSSDLSKMDLRKKMLAYGKKIEKPKLKKSEEQIAFLNGGLHSVSSAQTLKKGDMNERKNSPKPDVLERLARGIKPKVDKAEIHQITRRQLEKFEKLKQQGSVASPTKTDQKKAELLERKSKVKQLDRVGSGTHCRGYVASFLGISTRRQINFLQGTTLILITLLKAMQENEEGGRFQRKEARQVIEAKSSQKEEIYTTLMNKIRAKLVNPDLIPQKEVRMPSGPTSEKKIGLGLVDGTLRSINKGLLSRLSQKRGKQGDSSEGSLAQANLSRSKLDPKTIQVTKPPRAHGLEKDIRDLDALRTYQKKEIIGSGMLRAPMGILEKLKQSPARKRTQLPEAVPQPEAKSELPPKQKPETPGDRIRQGIESLKARVAQMPSQQQPPKVSEEESQPSKGININLYKRKVEKRHTDRDKEASLKVLQARRGDSDSVGRRNLTQTFTEKLRASRIADSGADY